MIGKIGSEVNIFVVFIFIIEIFKPDKAQALYLEQIWWLRGTLSVMRSVILYSCEAVMSAGKVVKLNIYIKSGHGSVMK